jgi:hypothetical protein
MGDCSQKMQGVRVVGLLGKHLAAKGLGLGQPACELMLTGELEGLIDRDLVHKRWRRDKRFGRTPGL